MNKYKETFSNKIKNEILNKKITRKIDILSELYGLFIGKNSILEESIVFKTEINEISNRVIENLDKIGNIRYNILCINNIKHIEIELKRDMFNKLNEKEVLKGLFLAIGYIKDPIKEYSLVFFVNNDETKKKLIGILKKENINYSYNKELVYIRNKEDILDLLISLNCVNSFFEYQNTIINKEINLKISRNMNYEIANETKKLMTSSEQLKLIKEIDNKIGIDNLTQSLKEVAKLRLENEEASLQELANILKITKSGIRNRFRRLKELYDERNIR